MLFEWRIYDVVPGKMMALHERFQRSEVEFLYGICCCVLLQVINEPVCEAG